MNAPDSPVAALRYFVSHNGEVNGPFDLDMIEAFILSGHYPQNVQICAEDSNQWKSHCVAVGELPPAVPRQTSQSAGAKPTGRILKWMLVAGGTLGVLILMAMYGPSSPPSSSYTPATSTYTTDPKPAAAWASKPYDSIPRPAATTADVVYRDTNGRTFNVLHNDYLRLAKQRDAIDREEAAITAIQAKEKAYSDRLESERIYLDRTNEYEIDAFNEKIDNLNASRAQLRQRINTFNRSIDAFNAELERVGTPVR